MNPIWDEPKDIIKKDCILKRTIKNFKKWTHKYSNMILKEQNIIETYYQILGVV